MIVEDQYDDHHTRVEFESHFNYDDLDGNMVRSLEFDLMVMLAPDVPGPLALLVENM